jgi:hypothetical protein
MRTHAISPAELRARVHALPLELHSGRLPHRSAPPVESATIAPERVAALHRLLSPGLRASIVEIG